MKKQTDYKLYGIFGFPLSHTLSPAMQEAAFNALDLKAFYLVLETAPERIGKIFSAMPDFALEGFNVTVPYKEKVIPYLDRLSDQARRIGAVNTVFRSGRRRVGTNTDVDGFSMSLWRDGRFRARSKKALVLGAGGGARAVVYGLARDGAAVIYIADIFEEKTKKLIRNFRRFFPGTRLTGLKSSEKELKNVLPEVDLVVNATAVGLNPKDPVILNPAWIPRAGARKRMLFYDLIYRPAVTPFLKNARSRGHRAVNGLGMLLYQGTRAFECWTHRKAPVSVMRRALKNALKENSRKGKKP